ncbi:cell division protein FtsW [Sphingomonas oleivorans]|uniref:Probable peptidoglycan glycosyltransferase FtsW n=1 Tax=Sphingomonas oleivorans TaxID=1735121 RepID=A0A2T5FY67_9SPHN|nr:putative peptidoglycan glycosyltransferase FtsW [Sphingomonas oleivorans]PTQ11475.1 cell division protein FtsW [Sphingomonas oleivorans]
MASGAIDQGRRNVRDKAQERRRKRGRGARLGRADRTPLGTWFWEIDRVLLLLVTVLIGIGLIAVAAASPAAAMRYSNANLTFPPLYYFYRQAIWIAIAVPVMIGVSMLPKPVARRAAMVGAGIFVALLALVPMIGNEVNGAQRWIHLGPVQVQPSEFLKPLFTVTLAWLLSLKAKDGSLPVIWLSFPMIGLVAFLLMKQPDFGQTVIFASIWLLLLTLSGAPIRFLAGLGAAGVGLIISAYLFYSVARTRIDAFLGLAEDGAQIDSYQTDSAHNTLTNGGLIGTGPGAGTMKFRLPEPHTDYIFSVIGEEFGLVACLAIAFIYLAIVVRVFIKLLHEEDDFLLLASAGLVAQFGLQALINMAVNVQIAPSKGMTLPFISYGGSSMVALSIGFGLLLAFTRANPYLNRSPYVVKWNGR